MKGPGLRLDLDVRRAWECPACGRRLRTAGSVTQLRCDCRGEASPSMRLVEPPRKTVSPFDHAAHAAQRRLDVAMGRVKTDATCEPPDAVASVEADATAENPRPDDAALPDTIPQSSPPLATSSFADDPAVRAAVAEEQSSLPPLDPESSPLGPPASAAVDPASVSDPSPGPEAP